MSDKWYNYQHMTFQTGQRIGSYRVLRHIGSGGVGEVYEVVHEQLQSRYAMKVFVAAGGNAALLRERFLAEARAMNRLRHPRIVRVYDLGIENDHPYLVMDLMVDSKGEPATIAAAKLKGGISEEKIYGWYLDLREALNAVHKAGIIHRDVKPVNVLLDADGRAMLSDFGVARYEGEIKCALSVENTFVTGQNASERPVFGTATYLAPEVCRGESATPASDLWSLGVLVLKLLTGISYERGIDLSLMLRPFSPCWMDVLPVLLSEDPQERQKASLSVFQEEKQPSRNWMKYAASIVAVFSAGSVLYCAKPSVARAYDEYRLLCAKKERCAFFDAVFAPVDK